MPPQKQKLSKADQQNQRRLFITGTVFGGLTFLTFLGLLVASMNGSQVPPGSRYLVTILLALGAGLSAGALVGGAALEGNIDLPLLGKSAPRIAFTGGAAIFVVVLLLGPRILPADAPLTLQITRATGAVIGKQPPKVLLDIDFARLQLGDGRRLYLIACSDAKCSSVLQEGLVDDPSDGHARLFVLASQDRVQGLQLIIKDATGHRVASTPPHPITW